MEKVYTPPTLKKVNNFKLGLILLEENIHTIMSMKSYFNMNPWLDAAFLKAKYYFLKFQYTGNDKEKIRKIAVKKT